MDTLMTGTNFNDLDDLDNSHFVESTSTQKVVVSKNVNSGYVENCPKCNGSGLYRGYSSHGRLCFKCEGRGTLTFKNSKEARQKATTAAHDRKERKADENLAKFEALHPAFAAWWTDSNFQFAHAMREAVRKFGDLTERQFNSAGACIERDREYKERKAVEAAARDVVRESAPAVNVLVIREILYRGKDKGIRRPIVRLAGPTLGFKFSLASDTSANAGAVYVNLMDEDSTYIGKIANGKFLRAGACTNTQESEVIAACLHPESSAVAYGRRYGSCSCCGRELTNHLSIELGIGPICREKFFV